jgi:hypothetical protein
MPTPPPDATYALIRNPPLPQLPSIWIRNPETGTWSPSGMHLLAQRTDLTMAQMTDEDDVEVTWLAETREPAPVPQPRVVALVSPPAGYPLASVLSDGPGTFVLALSVNDQPGQSYRLDADAARDLALDLLNGASRLTHEPSPNFGAG